MSQFKNINDKSMKLIMEQIKEQFDDENLGVETIKDYIENQHIVDGICQYFGLDGLYFEDYSYLCEMFVLNSDIEPPFRKPIKPKKIKVRHKEHYVKYGINYWQQMIDSYTLLDEEDLIAMQDSDMYYWWEGKLIDSVETEYETQEDDIDDVEWVE